MADEKLSDIAVWNRLQVASEALGEAKGQTVAGNTALEAARRALLLLQMGVLQSSETKAQAGNEPAQPPDPR
jgi:hypothetical protein